MKKAQKLMAVCMVSGMVITASPILGVSELALSTPIVSAQAKTVEDVMAGDTKVTGTVEANNIVTVRFEATGDKVTVDADANGEWEVSVPAGVSLKENDVLTVTITAADNAVSSETLTVKKPVEATTVETTTAPEVTEAPETTVDPETTQIPVETTTVSETSQAPVETTTAPETTVAETTQEATTVEETSITNFDRQSFEKEMIESTDMTKEQLARFTDAELKAALDEVMDQKLSGDAGTVYHVLKEKYPERFDFDRAALKETIVRDTPMTAEQFDKFTDAELIKVIETFKGQETGGDIGTLYMRLKEHYPDRFVDGKTDHFVSINEINSGAKIITGKTTPNATVTVRFEKTGEKVTVNADDKGIWAVDVPATQNLMTGDIVHSTSTNLYNDVAHQQTKVTPAKSDDTKVKHYVTINKVKVDSKTISGTTTPYGTVTVMFERQQEKVTVDADAKGFWSIQVPSYVVLNDGDVIGATSTSTDLQVAHTSTKVVSGLVALLPQTGESAQFWVYGLGVISLISAAILGLRHKNKSTNK